MKPHVRTVHTKHGNGYGSVKTYLVPALPRWVREANKRDTERKGAGAMTDASARVSYYDYEIQAWVDEHTGKVLPCGHGKAPSPGCTACEYPGLRAGTVRAIYRAQNAQSGREDAT